ncbi:hypothetical protein OROMI_016912 [Orobanche minor]
MAALLADSEKKVVTAETTTTVMKRNGSGATGFICGLRVCVRNFEFATAWLRTEGGKRRRNLAEEKVAATATGFASGPWVRADGGGKVDISRGWYWFQTKMK